MGRLHEIDRPPLLPRLRRAPRHGLAAAYRTIANP